MEKLILLVFTMLFCISLFSQNDRKQTMIIGVGQSNNTEIFTKIKEYTMTCQKDLKVVFVCEQHQVMLIESLNERYKDPMTLVSTLEKIFPDTDFYVKQSDDIFKKDCKDEYEKSIK